MWRSDPSLSDTGAVREDDAGGQQQSDAHVLRTLADRTDELGNVASAGVGGAGLGSHCRQENSGSGRRCPCEDLDAAAQVVCGGDGRNKFREVDNVPSRGSITLIGAFMVWIMRNVKDKHQRRIKVGTQGANLKKIKDWETMTTPEVA